MAANGKNLDGNEKYCNYHKPVSRMEYRNIRLEI